MPDVSAPTSPELIAFLSSTYVDLKAYRDKVEEALARIETSFRSMKFFGSKEGEPLEHALDKLRQCNYYIGIVGHRYGVVHETLGLSYTALEYEEAKKLGMSRRIYMADATIHIHPDQIEPDALRKKLEVFRQKLKKENTVVRFSSPEDLATKVVSDIALEKDRRARYEPAAEIRTDSEPVTQDSDSGRAASATSQVEPKPGPKSTQFRKAMAAGASMLVIGSGVCGSWLLHSVRARALTDKDTILLADFDNRTGDPIFDDTLKQALSVQLGQSPFLNVLSQRKVGNTLRFMGRPPNERVTADVARELCVRTGSKAIVLGSISNLGGQYVVGINAVACNSGDTLASEQETAPTKPDVLRALSVAAASLRGTLGESLASVQKFDVPFEATTTSLDALKAFTMGVKIEQTRGDVAAIPFLKRALELDRNFALAYADLGVAYSNLGQSDLARENIKKAYALRDRVSEREQYTISAHYYIYVKRELEPAMQTYELWAKSYPHAAVPHNSLAVIYISLGQYEKAVAETQESLRLDPNDLMSYLNLGQTYLQLNRLDEAAQVIQEVQQRKLDAEQLHWVIYHFAFLKGDAAEMQRQVAWAAGKPGEEDLLLSFQSNTEGYYGLIVKARDFSRRAIDSALRNNSKETAALWHLTAALREAEFGNTAIAKQHLAAALAMDSSQDEKPLVALASARVGETARAKTIADDLEKNNPSDTILKVYWLPTIKAAIELGANHPTQTVVSLEAAEPYELAWAPQLPVPTMYPVYLRGQAQLAAGNGAAAATEFQKFFDHRGVVLNYPLGALAQLGLARAYAMQGDTVKARAAYQDFLTLWKDADPDIPVLTQAQAEYASLK